MKDEFIPKFKDCRHKHDFCGCAKNEILRLRKVIADAMAAFDDEAGSDKAYRILSLEIMSDLRRRKKIFRQLVGVK
jgi:hypothetical protein